MATFDAHECLYNTNSDCLSYLGCYNDGSSRVAGQALAGVYTYDTCKAAAVNGNYKYFAIENTNDCYLINDYNTAISLGQVDPTSRYTCTLDANNHRIGNQMTFALHSTADVNNKLTKKTFAEIKQKYDTYKTNNLPDNALTTTLNNDKLTTYFAIRDYKNALEIVNSNEKAMTADPTAQLNATMLSLVLVSSLGILSVVYLYKK